MKKTILGFNISGKPIKAEISEAWHKYLIPEHFEVSVMSCIFPHIKTLIDIGSNEGIYCLVFANSKIKDKLIYAIEPQKQVANILENTVTINNWNSFFKVANIGFGNRNYNKKIYKSGSTTGASYKFRSKNFEVTKIIKLDDFIFKNKIVPDLIKIDVEGFEQEVINGGLNILKEMSPIIYIEILDSSNTKDTTIQVLTDIGYEIFVIRDNQFKKFKMDFKEIDMYLCVKKRNLSLIKEVNKKLSSRLFLYQPFKISKGNKFKNILNFTFLTLRYLLRSILK